MNSELLYTRSRSEGRHNGKLNEDLHKGEEIIDCNYELHMNLCNNNPHSTLQFYYK